jgi:hypothetical protein
MEKLRGQDCRIIQQLTDLSLKILHLLDVIKAWKSRLICGVVEECFKMQERFAGRVKPACGKFVDTVDKVSSI